MDSKTQAYLLLHRAFRLRAEDKKQEALEELTTFILTKNSVQVDRLLVELQNYEKNLYSVKPTTDPDIFTIMALRSSMAYRRMYPTWEVLRDLMVEKYGEGNTKLSGLIHPQIHNDLKGIVTPALDQKKVKDHIDMSLWKVIEDCCDVLGPDARGLVLDRIQESLNRFREENP